MVDTPALNSFESAALRLLVQKITSVMHSNIEAVAFGNARIGNDINATAMNYSGAVSYIQALYDVTGLCQEVEDELLGRAKPVQSVPAST